MPRQAAEVVGDGEHTPSARDLPATNGFYYATNVRRYRRRKYWEDVRRSRAADQRCHADLHYQRGLERLLGDFQGSGHGDGGEMDWTDTWRDAFRTELRAEAVGFARHGWPVVAGSYPRGSHWVGMPRSLRASGAQHGSVPVHPDWAQLAGCGPERVAELWSEHPFSVLLATGMGVDALDVPADLGRATAIGLRVAGVAVPIAATPTGRWLLPVLGGGALHRELHDHPDVVLHAEGAWVPLPPSPCLPGVVHWRVKPVMCGWELPRLEEVTDAVLAALDQVQPLVAS